MTLPCGGDNSGALYPNRTSRGTDPEKAHTARKKSKPYPAITSSESFAFFTEPSGISLEFHPRFFKFIDLPTA